MPDFRLTTCPRCGHSQVYAVIRKRVKFFVRRPDGSHDETKTCPGCRRVIPAVDPDTIVQQTLRTP